MLKILVLCTGNSCRSIMAEALFNHLGKGRIVAKSAGSFPTGQVHPKSLQTLANNDIATDGYYSKSWDVLENQNFDLLVTVCDRANGETCPIYLGNMMRTHWGVDDPAHAIGTDEDINQKFQEVFKTLELRIKALLKMEFEKLSPSEFKNFVDAIGAS
jgi:arsenate reductase (thioredoxin)